MVTLIGVFAAISTILMYIELPIPFMPPFLKIDLSGVPILIMGFMYGPLPAIYVTCIKDIIHMFSSQTGCVGELADIIILSCFAVVSSALYRRNPTTKGVALSVAAGAVTITVVGALANRFMLIPFYSQIMPLQAIIDACHAVNPMIDSINAYVIFGAAPFVISGDIPHWVDAFFETAAENAEYVEACTSGSAKRSNVQTRVRILSESCKA